MASLAIQAAEELRADAIEMPGVHGSVVPARNLALSVEAAKEEFPSWIFSHALRDCIEAVGPSLEWARKICFFWTRDGHVERLETGALRIWVTLPIKDWNSHMVQEASEFDRKPLRAKFQHLEQHYHLARPELAGCILTLNAARNCLAHRQGIVGPEDFNDTEHRRLRVAWRRLDIVAGTGEDQRILELPALVEAGETVGIRVTETIKSFALGERVTFTRHEFLEIAMTFFFFAQQIHESILSLQEAYWQQNRTAEDEPHETDRPN
jgi:hypothetical protein